MKEIITTAQIIAIADRVIPQWRDTHRIEVNVYARAAAEQNAMRLRHEVVNSAEHSTSLTETMRLTRIASQAH